MCRLFGKYVEEMSEAGYEVPWSEWLLRNEAKNQLDGAGCRVARAETDGIAFRTMTDLAEREGEALLPGTDAEHSVGVGALDPS